MSESIVQCRVCGSKSMLHHHFRVNHCNIVQCGFCGLYQVERVPSVSELTSIYSEGYFKNSKYVDDVAARHEFERRLSFIHKYLESSSASLLDFGCASGDFVAGINEHYSCSGVDFSPEAIEHAKEKYPELTDCFLSPDELSKLNIHFDVVMMWDVIEHISNPREVVKNICELLVNDGLFYISTPNIGSMIAKVMRKRWAFMTPPEHLLFFDKNNLKVLLQNNGFEVLEWESMGKYVNLAFLFYKLKRVFPKLIPQWLVGWLSRSRVGKWCIYIPTGDIQYVICKKVA